MGNCCRRYSFSFLPQFFVHSLQNDEAHKEGRRDRQVRHSLWCIPPKTSQEDGNHPARPIHLHFLRRNSVKRHSVGIWNCKSCKKTIAGGAWTVSTPAAAATRSTIRRLREIAEV